MKKYFIIVTILILFVSNALASDGVTFKFDIFQIDKTDSSKHLTYSDSADIVVGKTLTGFIGPFSIDIELLKADTIRASFNTHVVTLGTSANTYSKSFAVEYELPARFEKITGKNNSEYLLIISPRLFKTDIELQCDFSAKIKGSYSVKPTAHTEIYYVPSTLSDFYWDSIKALMETNYELFKEFFHLNIPGKTHIYVPPCPTSSVIWDKRFGTSVDPTRNTAYAIYNNDYNTVDPFIFTYAATLRTYGYSNPFLSEGMANYFSLALFDMKKIITDQTNIPLENLVKTYDYLQADAIVAERTSATFSRFLIDSYSLTKFMTLYKQTDDINFSASLQEVYNKSVSELEQEWLHYVDTTTIPKNLLITFANSSEMMLKYNIMHSYNVAYLDKASTYNDSLSGFSNLKRSSFFTGNYYQAVEYQQQLIDLMTNPRGTDWMTLGAYALMASENNQALTYFTTALELDSANKMIKFNLALCYHSIGDSKKAKEILLSNFRDIKGAGTQGETRIFLADILSKSDKKSDQESAGQYYQETVNLYSSMIQANSSLPTAYMWLGKSYYGLRDYDNAINNLLIARFIESTPFYLGMIDLNLGKAYIAIKENELAEHHLTSVISTSTAVYHQKEAKELLEQLKK